MERPLSEKQVLKTLDIPDFRHMSKDKVLMLSSMLPQMDEKVAIKVLEQYPEFISALTSSFTNFTETYKDILEKNHKGVMSYYEMCNSTIEVLNKLLKRRFLSFDNKMKIVDRINEITASVSEKEREDKEFHDKMSKRIGGVALAAIAVAGAALGVKFLKK